MLMESSVDPFDAQEAKPYKNDNEVLAMTNLVEAYQKNDIMAFERILKTNRFGNSPLHHKILSWLLTSTRRTMHDNCPLAQSLSTGLEIKQTREHHRCLLEQATVQDWFDLGGQHVD